MRDHIPLLVKFDDAAHQIGGGHVTGEYEDAECAARGRPPRLDGPGRHVADRRLGQAALPGGDAVEHGVVAHLDLRVVLRLGGHRRIAGEVVLAHQDRDLAGVFGEEHRFLGRGEPAADHQHLTAGEELAVAGRAVGHAAAGVFGFPFEPELARAGTGGHQDAEGPQIAARGVHDLDIALHIQTGRLGAKELGAEILRLPAHRGRQRPTAGRADARIIDHFIGDGDLAAEIGLLQDQHAVARPGQIQARGQAGGAAADHNHVIEILVLDHCVLLPSPRTGSPTATVRGDRASRTGLPSSSVVSRIDRCQGCTRIRAGRPDPASARWSRRRAATWPGRPGRRARTRTARPARGAAARRRCGPHSRR